MVNNGFKENVYWLFYKQNPHNPWTKLYPRIFQVKISISQYISRNPRNPRIGRHPVKDLLWFTFPEFSTILHLKSILFFQKMHENAVVFPANKTYQNRGAYWCICKEYTDYVILKKGLRILAWPIYAIQTLQNTKKNLIFYPKNHCTLSL